MIRLFRSLAFLFACVLATPSAFALPDGISGSWFNPAQGGHGLSVEVLADGRAIVYWFVYDTSGRPIHLYVDGEVIGNTIYGLTYYNEGMRFGSFDPATRRQTVWGHVRVSFTDCHHGELHYVGDGPAGAGYGEGRIPMQRLATIGDLACRFPIAGGLPVGAYDVSTSYPSIFSRTRLYGAVDPSGQAWATVEQPTGTMYVGRFRALPLVTGDVVAQDGTLSTVSFAVRDLSAFGNIRAVRPLLFDGMFTRSGAGADANIIVNAPEMPVLSWTGSAARTAAIQRPFDAASLVGIDFRTVVLQQFVNSRIDTRFLSGDTICVGSDGLGGCAMRGTVRASHPGWTFFDFNIAAPGGKRYSGRGWIEYVDNTPLRVVLVGKSGDEGLGLVGTRTP
jgi:hypothetical protein